MAVPASTSCLWQRKDRLSSAANRQTFWGSSVQALKFGLWPVEQTKTSKHDAPIKAVSAQIMFYDPSFHLPPSLCAMAHIPYSWEDVVDLAKLQLDYPASIQVRINIGSF